MSDFRLAAIRRRGSVTSTHLQVYVAVRDAIVHCELEPGRRLSENELAAQLGVSRTPVREALARLRDDRLVEVVPQLGTFVAAISTAAVADAQFVREALECAAVRAAAERRCEDDLHVLEESLAAQERAGSVADGAAFSSLDHGFHQTLCNLSGHPIVWAISQRAKGHLNRIRLLSLEISDYLPAMIAEHRAVVDAVARRDPDEAELALRYHLRQVLREVPRIRRQYPTYFEDR